MLISELIHDLTNRMKVYGDKKLILETIEKDSIYMLTVFLERSNLSSICVIDVYDDSKVNNV